MSISIPFSSYRNHSHIIILTAFFPYPGFSFQLPKYPVKTFLPTIRPAFLFCDPNPDKIIPPLRFLQLARPPPPSHFHSFTAQLHLPPKPSSARSPNPVPLAPEAHFLSPPKLSSSRPPSPVPLIPQTQFHWPPSTVLLPPNPSPTRPPSPVL